MELFIPEIGTILKLEQDWQFTLYSEYRNNLHIKLNITRDTQVVELPKGTLVKMDRIYVKKGNSQFSSITFSIPTVRSKADKLNYPHNVKLGGGKFWVKLHECNGINFSLLESNEETVNAVKELYAEIEIECNSDKNSPFRNSTNLLKLFNIYLGLGTNLNNIVTNDSLDTFLNKMLVRMEKNSEKNIETFRKKFKSYIRDFKLRSIFDENVIEEND
jgi:hypothetical protein